MPYLLLHAGQEATVGPGDGGAGHTCLPQILLSCRQEGKAYAEHGGAECSLILRAEASCSIGCSKALQCPNKGGLGFDAHLS